MLEIVLTRLGRLPITGITLAATVLALLFNLGFFYAVGIAFLGLFAFQEHLIFAMSGAVVILVIVTVASSTFNLVANVEGSEERSRWWWINVSIAFCSLVYIVVDRVLTYDHRYGQEAALCLLALIVCSLLTAGLLTLRAEARHKAMLAVGAGTLCAFLAGTVYGNQQLHERNASRRVVGPDGTEFTLVRAGIEYSVVVSAEGRVKALKTERLRELFYSD